MGSNKLRIALYGGIHFVQLFTVLLTLGGIASQARYGTENICLLFIEDYKEDLQNPGFYMFSANSSACSGIIGMAAVGLILTLLIGSASLYYIIRAEFRAVRLILAMAIVGMLMVLGGIVMSAIATIGISQTCNQIKGQNFDCKTVFKGGFFQTETEQTQSKSINTINAAIGAGYVCTVSWLAYTLLELLNWRTSM